MIELLHPLMWKYYFYNIIYNQINLIVLIISIILSLFFYFSFRKTNNLKEKTKFLYAHIFLLFFPLIFSAIFWMCGMSFLSCPPMYLPIFLPLSLVSVLLLNFIFAPYFYSWDGNNTEIKQGRMKEFVGRQYNKLNLNEPKIYSINNIKPMAFSISNRKPSIFVSAGLAEILTEKELQAVLLHEMHHIKNRSSFWKFSLTNLKTFSPLVAFMTVKDSLDNEEREADAFAKSFQGTEKYILSAKKKIRAFNYLTI